MNVTVTKAVLELKAPAAVEAAEELSLECPLIECPLVITNVQITCRSVPTLTFRWPSEHIPIGLLISVGVKATPQSKCSDVS